MAKQQVIKLNSGATLIYQKQGAFNGYSFAIGFRGGSQLDGKFKGLSHALEHMLVKAPNYKSTKVLLDNLLKYTINQNAFTTKDTICVSSFSCVDKNIDEALQLTQNMLTRKSFSKEQLDKEIEVIKQEILLDEDDYNNHQDTALDYLFGELQNDDVGFVDILGSSKTLKLLTPSILSTYMKRYFNLENMVVSVTTNKSLENVMELCNKYLFSVVKPASNPKFIVGTPTPKTYKDINTMVALPNMNHNNISICLLLRERSTFSDDINMEYAYDTIEEYLMNSVGGLLWDVLREKTPLVYTYSMSNIDCTTAKFKAFQATTNSQKMRKTITEICKIIREISLYGVTEKKFNSVKNALIDIKTATLNKFKSTSAESNYFDFIEGYEFIDYKKVNDNISKITYEDFNNYISSVYSTANVSLAVEGNFDTRKCFRLIEIEKMLGNYSHVDMDEEFNLPIIETTPLTDPNMELMEQAIKQVYLQQNSIKKDDSEFISIDNEVVK